MQRQRENYHSCLKKITKRRTPNWRGTYDTFQQVNSFSTKATLYLYRFNKFINTGNILVKQWENEIHVCRREKCERFVDNHYQFTLTLQTNHSQYPSFDMHHWPFHKLHPHDRALSSGRCPSPCKVGRHMHLFCLLTAVSGPVKALVDSRTGSVGNTVLCKTAKPNMDVRKS